MTVVVSACVRLTTEVPPPAAVSKNGRKSEGNSIFSWIFVLALLGVWTAVGVVWFDIVDYDTVVGMCLWSSDLIVPLPLLAVC